MREKKGMSRNRGSKKKVERREGERENQVRVGK